MSLNTLITSLDVNRRGHGHFDFDSKGEPKNFNEIIDLEYAKIKAQRLFQLQEYVDQGFSKDEVSRYNPNFGTNCLMLAITYQANNVLDYILSNKMFTPDELRAMKNSMDYNIITLARLFNNSYAENAIREYVKN